MFVSTQPSNTGQASRNRVLRVSATVRCGRHVACSCGGRRCYAAAHADDMNQPLDTRPSVNSAETAAPNGITRTP
jgi:hypothetical protein